jgi:uncharacterized protein (DUF952 family)
MNESVAYKILTAEEAEALRRDAFAGAKIDVADGYIHLSTAGQVSETVRRHFAGQNNLTIAAVDLAALGDAVRWEASRGGALFPHVYGKLTLPAVLGFRKVECGADGEVVLHGFDNAR